MVLIIQEHRGARQEMNTWKSWIFI